MNMNIETGNTLNRIKHMTKDGKALLVTLGAVGSVTALGVAAAAIYNSRQMRTARTVKRTGKIRRLNRFSGRIADARISPFLAPLQTAYFGKPIAIGTILCYNYIE